MSIPDDNEYLPVVQTFDDLMGAEELWTFDSEELTDKSSLVGVPFVITEVAYRYTELKDPADAKAPVISSDYVSVTGRVASADVMAVAKERADKLGVFFPTIAPESLVVFNDGSTGIRRQLTGLLHQAKLIDIGPIDPELRNGNYDRKFFNWASHKESPDGELQPPTINTVVSGKQLVIKVLKGLRLSEYDYGTQRVKTYYLS